MKYSIFFTLLLVGFASCRTMTKETAPPEELPSVVTNVVEDTLIQAVPAAPDYDTTEWVDMLDLDTRFILDLRYATTNNFVQEQMYDCARCFLRPAVGEAIVAVQKVLSEQGLRLKFFDCYRPRPIQWALWKKVPNPTYVADPRKGSMHNRGSAVDLTLVDSMGKALDMGTDFDFFGRAAHHDYFDHPETVLNNRKLLKTTMEQHGFQGIRTEWWHYSYTKQSYPIADMLWQCPSSAH